LSDDDGQAVADSAERFLVSHIVAEEDAPSFLSRVRFDVIDDPAHGVALVPGDVG